MTDVVIEARAVRVRYETGVEWTGRGVDLDVEPGEFVLLLGPSGCGKSTFSLTLNGLVPHSVPADLAGVVRVSGVDTRTTKVGALAAEVAMVFQDPDAQVVTTAVFDEVCFGLENLRLPVAEIERRARSALVQVGLAGRADDDPETLSGGERQRLALACALAMRPKVLVLDEPTANLDPVGGRELYEHLVAAARDHRIAVVVIEHDLDDVIVHVDRVVVLGADGGVRMSGAPREIFGARVDELVALGVWLPTAVAAARRLADAGVHVDEVTVTPEELAHALRRRELPAPVDESLEVREATGPGIAVRDLRVRRGDRVVIDSVSLEVPPGDFLAIIGVNGAGKTTLAQCIARVRTPPSGTVRVGGQEAVGYVFQNPEHQFVASTVFDELAYGLRARRLARDEVAARVERMLDRLDLARYRDVSPFTLSHGEKRRLSVGTALICGPRLLVLDEPTFGQDRSSATELLALLTELNAEGHTVVVVTHDLQLVAEHAAHVVVLASGRVLAHGPVREVFASGVLLAAGLRQPPVRRMVEALGDGHPGWRQVYRLADLPGGGS